MQCGLVSGVAIAIPASLASLVLCPSVLGLLLVTESLPFKPEYLSVLRAHPFVTSAIRFPGLLANAEANAPSGSLALPGCLVGIRACSSRSVPGQPNAGVPSRQATRNPDPSSLRSRVAMAQSRCSHGGHGRPLRSVACRYHQGPAHPPGISFVLPRTGPQRRPWLHGASSWRSGVYHLVCYVAEAWEKVARRTIVTHQVITAR